MTKRCKRKWHSGAIREKALGSGWNATYVMLSAVPPGPGMGIFVAASRTLSLVAWAAKVHSGVVQTTLDPVGAKAFEVMGDCVEMVGANWHL